MAEVTLFTLPKGFVDPHTALIQRNALASWRALAPAVEVVVLGQDEGVREAALAAGAAHLPDVATNEFGTPLLDSAFALVAARSSAPLLCYVNADIVLLGDFVDAVRQLPQRPYLAIGRRWDTDVTAPVDFADGGAALRELAVRSGSLDLGRGSDYFVFRRETDFGLPPFAVGRPGWDNWMIGRALELRLPLIDVTPSVLAVHQNHGYAHVAGGGGSWEGPEAKRNRELATGIERYVHSPFNATHLLEPTGLAPARSPAHLRARAEAFITLAPVARPLYGLIRLVRRSGADQSSSR
jgi:hypothetical protein